MQISAEHYFHAALERIRQANLIYRAGDSYALAMYTSGLAVESMLRAFRWKKDQSFEGRHDLLRLFRESGLLQLNEEHLQSKGLSPATILDQVARFQGIMNHIVLLWTNDLRYAPDALARSRVVKMRLYEQRKGNILKGASLRLQNAAQEIITRGAFLWTWSKK
ncbi:MAG TPA: HEPN domain-containing protein [Pirellulales bacterium]